MKEIKSIKADEFIKETINHMEDIVAEQKPVQVILPSSETVVILPGRLFNNKSISEITYFETDRLIQK